MQVTLLVALQRFIRSPNALHVLRRFDHASLREAAEGPGARFVQLVDEHADRAVRAISPEIAKPPDAS
jgi:hypothetical protein